MRKAGELLNWLMNDPVGEEVGEGTLGGLMAGAAQLGSDQPLAQTALQTAAAIAGGIGMGMLGRRIGARLGKHFHEGELKDQYGLLASAARISGSETTVGGMNAQAVMTKELMQEHLTQGTIDHLMQQAVADPRGFAARYGIEAERFKEAAKYSPGMRAMAVVARNLENMPPEHRGPYLERIRKAAPIVDDVISVDRIIGEQAAKGMDDNIREAAEILRKAGGMEGIFKTMTKEVPLDELDPTLRAQFEEASGMLERATKSITPEALLAMLDPAPRVTGEHVGRMIGRFVGDEVGVIGGLMTGNLLSQALGITKEDDLKPQQPSPATRPPMP